MFVKNPGAPALKAPVSQLGEIVLLRSSDPADKLIRRVFCKFRPGDFTIRAVDVLNGSFDNDIETASLALTAHSGLLVIAPTEYSKDASAPAHLFEDMAVSRAIRKEVPILLVAAAWDDLAVSYLNEEARALVKGLFINVKNGSGSDTDSVRSHELFPNIAPQNLLYWPKSNSRPATKECLTRMVKHL